MVPKLLHPTVVNPYACLYIVNDTPDDGGFMLRWIPVKSMWTHEYHLVEVI